MKQKQILLVEDDAFLVDIYTTKLNEEGFVVEVAKTGEEALKKLEKIKPDLILLDIVLPGIDGWEILKKVKADPKLKNIQVVILSNLGRKEEVEKGINLGSVKYLVKANYTPTEVVEEIKLLFKNE
jgi:DNA-binding response OmpR family regulator